MVDLENLVDMANLVNLVILMNLDIFCILFFYNRMKTGIFTVLHSSQIGSPALVL